MEKTDHPLVIIGAGPAGLYLSVFLNQNKIPHILIDQAEELQNIGFGILLQENLFTCLSLIGITKNELSVSESYSVKIATTYDKSLADINLTESPIYSSTRGELLRILKSRVNPEVLLTGKRLLSVRLIEKKYLLTFSDNTIITTSYVIGADGIKSVVRDNLFTKNAIKTVYSALYVWLKQETATMTVHPSPNTNIVIFPTPEKSSVLFIATKEKINEPNLPPLTLAKNILSQNDNFEKSLIPQFDFKKPGLLTIVRRIKPFRFVKKNTALIGDAAHGETPILGWGTTIAIEDAYILGKLLTEHSNNPSKALRAYYAERKTRVAVLHRLTTLEEMTLGVLDKKASFARKIILTLILPVLPFLFNTIRSHYKKLYFNKIVS